MVRRFRDQIRNTRGGTLVFVAAGLAGFLGMGALAIDLGMLYTARAEAQRAADAAALAGASAFQEIDPPAEAVDDARERAYEYALRNIVRNVRIDSADVESVVVDPSRQRVDVTIRREEISLWFARILGIDAADVAAHAAAEAIESGSSQCLKPFALPDLWYDADDDTYQNDFADPGNKVWDFDPNDNGPQTENEIWDYSAEAGDGYSAYEPENDTDLQTGYGSSSRNDEPDMFNRTYENDYGRQVMIKSNDPQSALDPGAFYPWVLPLEDTTGDCDIQYGGTENGGKSYAANICNCNTSAISLDSTYTIKTGNMIGPTKHGLDALLDQDPDARWVDHNDPDWERAKADGENRGYIEGSVKGDNWTTSPRVVKIALFDPTQGFTGASQPIKFNNFALLFIEELNNGANKAPVVARFLGPVVGTDPGGTTGSLIKTLRLVD